MDGGIDFLQSATYGACGARFGVASAMPRRAYTSAVFQELENEKVWTRDWVCIGTSPEIAKPGDLLPYTLGEHAIHVQRLASGGLIGRFNKAQHGGCRSIPAQCQTGRKTKCSYTSCGHSRDRGVIAGDLLNELTPQAGQYLGVYPERLLHVNVHTGGPFIFANVDPTLGRDICPPAVESEVDPRAMRVDGEWQEYRANWKLAGAALVDTARSCESGGGASNYVSAEWHFPNLVLIKARNATLAIILQPTAFDQALWRLSFFREQRATDVSYGSDHGQNASNWRSSPPAKACRIKPRRVCRRFAMSRSNRGRPGNSTRNSWSASTPIMSPTGMLRSPTPDRGADDGLQRATGQI